MRRIAKIFAVASPVFLFVLEGVDAQPAWVAGTPSVPSAGPLSITLNYGLDRAGNVYYIVYNFDNPAQLTSTYVRNQALLNPGGTKVASGVLQVRKGDARKVLQTVINVNDPNQVHTIYVVAADGKGVLQANPVRMNITTLPCPQANAGPDGEECDLNFTFSAVLNFGTGTWTRISGPGTASFSPNANSPVATVTVSAYGLYTFRWTVTMGVCTSYDEVIIDFYQPPQSNAGRGGNECGLEYPLSATPPASGTGTWTMTSGTGTASFMPDANNPSAVAIVSDYGTKIFTWTVVNGPCSSSSGVTVNFYEQPVADAGNGGNNCGPEFYLNANPSTGSGLWSRVSGPGSAVFSPDAADPDAKVTVSLFGSYVFRWTETNGSCSSSSTVTVNFSQEMSANAGSGGNECDRDFKLNAIPSGGTGTWTKFSGPGNVIFSPDAHHADALVSVTQYGDYDFAWTEVKDNCSSTDLIRVAFHSPPAVSAGPDLAICKGNTVQLMATGSGSFLWTPGNLVDNPQVYNPVLHTENTVTLTVTLTDQWGCHNSDQVTIDVRDIPFANAGNDKILDYVFKTNLEGNQPGASETGEWMVLSGTGQFADKNDPFTQVTDLSLGKNILVWKVSNDVCPASSDTVSILVNDLMLPSLITPNMDGKNDFYVLKGIQSMGKTELSVFNRWGALVFSDSNYNNLWDGKDNDGNPLPDDTYFTIIKSENAKPISGFVVIRR